MNKNFLNEIIRRRNPLLPAIIEFNLRPARYIHQSWVSHLLEESVLEKLRGSPRAEKRLSAFLLAEFDLQQEFILDFENRIRRLALLDTDSLTQLVYLTGIALNASRIARIIERAPLLSVKNSIGEKAYLFALKKAPFLMGRMEFAVSDCPEEMDYHTHAFCCGMKCLQACFSGEPEALARRLFLKFPKDMYRNVNRLPKEVDQPNAWRIFRKVLLQEVKPEWASFLN